MTRRIKRRFLSPELPSSSDAETPRYKHHRKAPKLPQYEPDYSEEEEDNEDDEEFASVTSPNNQLPPSLSHVSASNSSNTPKIMTQIDSFINIAPFPIFGGKSGECPATHLSRFLKVCRANNVSSTERMMKIFPVTLENEAFLWYDLKVEPYPSLTWEEIKSSFLEAYRKKDYDKQLRFELMNLNQEQGESVQSYFLRLRGILHQWPENGIPDTLIKVIFIDGLRRDFKEWIIPQKPDSLADALRLAFTWEQVRIVRSDNKKDSVKCGFCDGAHKETECEIRGRMKEWRIKSGEGKRFGDSPENIDKGSGDEKTEELVLAGDSRREEEGVQINGKKKSRCQCSKHQCGKKRLQKNMSNVTVNSSNYG